MIIPSEIQVWEFLNNIQITINLFNWNKMTGKAMLQENLRTKQNWFTMLWLGK